MTIDYAEIKEYALSAFPTSITWQVKQVPNDSAEKDEWKRNAAKFQLTLTNGRVSETFDYWLGCGHWKWSKTQRFFEWSVPACLLRRFEQATRPTPAQILALKCSDAKTAEEVRAWVMKNRVCDTPHPIDIINFLLMDASATEQTFEEWCSEFGYDTDSRKAEETYRACDEAGKRLYRVLCRDLCDTIRQRIEERGGL